ncbi:MAG: phosphoribosylformimino-5-aminoimidazole carboxamide ribotide isomerase [Lachnospiraceae bacterium]|nr:phosphoribosylformimino-5-aminoimidazole carboxamide ribotide isomerase [Lachnospiraceae bacterium]
MKFRPCIDIHNGCVKQIVGGSLQDTGDKAKENFVAEQDAGYYANMYKELGISGGHIILLNDVNSPYYDMTKEQALLALEAYRGGMQVGGGVDPKNAMGYLDAGATHVIVTSYVFNDGHINMDNLRFLNNKVGKEHIVLDLSCKKQGDKYYVATNRWQKLTDVEINEKLFYELEKYCDEFLVHAVDVEGKAKGIEEDVAKILGNLDGMKVTYAGGIGSFSDLDKLKEIGQNKVDFTVGSALDIFGGNMNFNKVCAYR